MLTPAQDFLHDVSWRSPPDTPDVCLVQGEYSPALFEERLFDSLALPAPPSLINARPKRRAEYLASRLLARYALCRMGAESWLLINDADRAPVWPEGFVGSLSHSQQSVVLLLAKAETRKLAGVDIEKVMGEERAEAVQHAIITPVEKSRLLASGLPFPVALTLAFSLKESLFKALFPVLRKFMEFHQAEILYCAPQGGEVVLRLTQQLSSDFPAGFEFTGRTEITSAAVLSWIIASRP